LIVPVDKLLALKRLFSRFSVNVARIMPKGETHIKQYFKKPSRDIRIKSRTKTKLAISGVGRTKIRR